MMKASRKPQARKTTRKTVRGTGGRLVELTETTQMLSLTPEVRDFVEEDVDFVIDEFNERLRNKDQRRLDFFVNSLVQSAVFATMRMNLFEMVAPLKEPDLSKCLGITSLEELQLINEHFRGRRDLLSGLVYLDGDVNDLDYFRSFFLWFCHEYRTNPNSRLMLKQYERGVKTLGRMIGTMKIEAA